MVLPPPPMFAGQFRASIQKKSSGGDMRFLRNGATAILLFVSVLAAQGVRATIVGRVTDDSGAVVPGANITITNTGTNESRSVIVNDSGEYAIPQLAPGQYTLMAEYR